MKITANYGRTSSDHQMDNNSIFAQLEAGKRLAEFFGLQNVQIYEDDCCSSKTLNRPEMLRLLNDIESGRIENIIIDDWNRLIGAIVDGDKLIKIALEKDINIWESKSFCQIKMSTADERMFLGMRNVMTQHRLEKIGEDTVRGIKGGLQKGTYTISMQPSGYRKNLYKKDIIDLDERKKAIIKLIPIDEYLQVIKTMFEWYTIDLLSMIEIELKLVEEYEPKYHFKQPKIQRILSNEKYTGSFTYKNILIDGSKLGLIPLITKEMFDVATARRNSSFKHKKYDYLFFKKVICQHCNNYLKSKPTKKKNKVYLYYECSDKYCDCKTRTTDEKLLSMFADEIVTLYNKHNIPFYSHNDDAKKISNVKELTYNQLKSTIVNHLQPKTI